LSGLIDTDSSKTTENGEKQENGDISAIGEIGERNRVSTFGEFGGETIVDDEIYEIPELEILTLGGRQRSTAMDFNSLHLEETQNLLKKTPEKKSETP
jgi:hypothetical protein